MKNRLACFTFALLIALSASATLWTGGGAQFPDGSYVWTNKTNWGGSNAPLNSGGNAQFPENCEVTVNLDGVFTQNSGRDAQMGSITIPASSHVTFVGNARGTNSWLTVNNAGGIRRLTLANGARIGTSSNTRFPVNASIVVTNGSMLVLGGGIITSGVHIAVLDGSQLKGNIGPMYGGASIRLDHSLYGGGNVSNIKDGTISLENGSVGILSGLTLGANGTFRLAGGSSASVSGTLYTKATGGHFVLSGRSTLTAKSYFQTGLKTTFDIDDSTVVSETQGLTLCNGSGDTGGDTFTFRGDNPQLLIKNGLSIQNNASVGANGVILNFEVPEKGFIDAPVCHTATGSKAFGNPTYIKPNGVNANFVHVNLLASSPALDPDYAYATLSKLLFTAGGLQNTAFLDCKVEGADNQAAFAFTLADGETETTTAANVRFVTARMENGAGGKPLAVRGVAESTGVADYSVLTVNRRAITFTSAVTTLADAPLETYAVLYEGESSSSLAPVATNAIGATGNFSMTWTGSIFLKTYYFRVALETRTAGGEVTHVEWSDTRSAATQDTTTYTWRDVDGDWTGDWGDDRHWADNQGGDCYGHPVSKDANVIIPGGHDIEINLDAPYTCGKFRGTNDNIRLTLTVPAGLRDANKLTAYNFGNNTDYSGFGGTNCVLVFDGVSTEMMRLQISVGKCSSLVFTNSAYCLFRFLGVNSADAWIRLYGGSYAYVWDSTGFQLGSSSSAANPCGLVVDDSTFYAGNTLSFSSSSSATAGGSILLRGRNARLVNTGMSGKNIFSSTTSRNVHRVVFEVPSGGYASTPFQVTDSTGSAAFSLSSATAQLNVVFEIADGSGAYDAKKVADLPLMTSACGINTNCVSFTRPKHAGRGNTFLYGTATTSPYGWAPVADFSGTAKAIGLRVMPRPGTVLMVQ